MQQEEPNKYVKELTQEKYKYGFTTDVHTDIIERGLNEDVVRLISEKKGEPEWLKRHAWKACKPLKGFAGSNPALSALRYHDDY